MPDDFREYTEDEMEGKEHEPSEEGDEEDCDVKEMEAEEEDSICTGCQRTYCYENTQCSSCGQDYCPDCRVGGMMSQRQYVC